MTLLAASLAGAVGAVCRYLLGGWAQERVAGDFPVGTLVVNLLGTLVLGMLIGGGATRSTLIIAAVGFCGGFTTFSTWMVETLRLGPFTPRAMANLGISIIGGFVAAVVGYTLVA